MVYTFECCTRRGNTLYIYGGVTELGDVEVALDDCWYVTSAGIYSFQHSASYSFTIKYNAF